MDIKNQLLALKSKQKSLKEKYDHLIKNIKNDERKKCKYFVAFALATDYSFVDEENVPKQSDNPMIYECSSVVKKVKMDKTIKYVYKHFIFKKKDIKSYLKTYDNEYWKRDVDNDRTTYNYKVYKNKLKRMSFKNITKTLTDDKTEVVLIDEEMFNVDKYVVIHHLVKVIEE